MPHEFIPVAKPMIGPRERSAVDAVLASGMVVQGPQVAAFEEEFSEQVVGGVHTVAVNSGTSAQHLATLACGFPPGAEVIMPSFAGVEAAITARTVAIEVVHLYGLPANIPEILRIARAHGLAVLEDCAQAHAAAVDGRPVGTFGTWGSFSFYATKNMTSLEGGMVTTRDAGLARRVRLLRNHGMERQYANELVGLNNRMTDSSAAVGRVQLSRLAEWTARRRGNAAFLDEGLAGAAGVVTPTAPPGYTHVYHQYTVRFEGATGAERTRIQTALKDEWQIGTGVYYPIPCHRLESLAPYAPGLELPGTEKAARECLSLPVHPSLSRADLARIVEAVTAVVGAGA